LDKLFDMKMKTMRAKVFKNKCLAVLDEVQAEFLT